MLTRPPGLRVVVAMVVGGAMVVLTACGDAPRTGGVTQKPGRAGCVSTTGTKGACARGDALVTPGSVVVSPDGKHVYVASEDRYRGGVAIFDRAANGTVRQKRGRSGCVSETGLRRACRQAIGVRAPRDLAISPDGRNVYVAAASGAVAVLDRDATDGTLTQRTGRAGCLARVGRRGACVRARGLHNPQGIVVSPDGSNVYVTSFEDDALTVFDRNAASGALKQKPGRAGCLAGEYSAARGCRTASLQVGLDGPALTVSGDGKHVYAGQPLQIFDRHANGEATRSPSLIVGSPSRQPAA